MISDPTPQQIQHYRDKGFVAIEGFLDASELAHWRNVTEKAVADKVAGKEMTNQVNPEDYYAKVFTQALRLADTSAEMKKLIYDPRIGKCAATLAGIDGIRVWHDQALFKQPFGNPTSYHLDNPYWSFSSRDAISIWIALDDATLENGCMWYIPGSHKLATYENVGIGPNLSGLFKVYPEWMTIDPIPAPAKAGTAVFHNGLTAHGAGANMTNKPRRAMTCAFMPDGATFNGIRNILPEAYFKSLKVGDLLNDETQNPLIWSKGK